MCTFSIYQTPIMIHLAFSDLWILEHSLALGWLWWFFFYLFWCAWWMVGGTRVAVIMGSFELTWSTSCLCFWEPVRTCDMLTLLHLVRIYSPTVSTLLLSVISFANIISNQGAVILHPKLLLCPRTSECFPSLPSFPPVGSLHLHWPSFFSFLSFSLPSFLY